VRLRRISGKTGGGAGAGIISVQGDGHTGREKFRGGVKLSGENEDEGYQSEKIQVQNMVKYIQEHFGEGLTLATLAGEFKMSESYISSLIKKRTGKGFGEHLMEVRIQKAQEYLRTTNDSIEAIAERVGYPDYFYFTKVYKKATGISPAAYRRQL
ncbi:MAG: helix-turn-helix domain-containing protein, partial [Eisenbergiella massiliensis]